MTASTVSIKGHAIAFLTTAELAQVLNIEETLIPSLEIAKHTFAGCVRFDYKDVQAYIKASRSAAPSKGKSRVEFARRHKHLELVPEPPTDGPPAPTAA